MTMELIRKGKTEDCVNIYKKDGIFYAKNDFLDEPIDLGENINLDEVSMMRDYQVKQVHLHLEQFLAGKSRHACVMPTGAGKTMTARFLVSWGKMQKHLGVKPGENIRVLFVGGHRLLTQAKKTFEGLNNVDLLLSTPGREIPKDFNFHIAIYDEGHHEATDTWQDNLPTISNRPMVYLTATPERGDDVMIKVNVEVKAVNRIELENRGLLAKMRVYSILDPGLKANSRVDLLVEYIRQYDKEMGKVLVTVKTHKEAKLLYQRMQDELGLRVGLCVDVTKDEVDNIIHQLESGEIDYIVNCNKLNEGVDISGLTDVILGRQFRSAAELNQNVGRGIRPKSEGDNIGKIHQFINPIKKSLDACVDVGGVPESHWLRDFKDGAWRQGRMA